MLAEVENIKLAVVDLSPQAKKEFQRWYEDWAWKDWDHQLEADVEAGKLDALAEQAIRSFEAGDYTEL